MDSPALYLAPLEGITIYLYRNIFHKYFGKGYVVKYFTPFLVPRGKGRTMSEQREVALELNGGLPLIPQVLTDSPELFVSYAKPLRDMGYEEINLNFGCPSGTVTSKGRGSAILTREDAMRRVLDAACSVEGIRVSVKTRLGMEKPEEFYDILEVYNEYPLEELIIHARVKKEMYSRRPHVDMFKYAMENSKNPVVYNGDIWTVEDYRKLKEACHREDYRKLCPACPTDDYRKFCSSCPTEDYRKLCPACPTEDTGDVDMKNIPGNPYKECKSKTATPVEEAFPHLAVMLGRGAIADPWLPAKLKGVEKRSPEEAWGFISEIEEAYREILSGDSQLLDRMKEVWTWYIRSFPGNEKNMKKLLKTRSIEEFRELEKAIILG